jgi:hypothetical protein
MSLLFCDSFDHDDTLSGWIHTAAVAIGGRNGKCLQVDASENCRRIGWDDAQTVIVGFALKLSALDLCVCNFWNDTTAQVGLYVRSDGLLSVRRGDFPGTEIGISTRAIGIGIWYYVEIKVLISNTGAVEVRVNGDAWIKETGVDTQYTSFSSANVFNVQSVAGAGTFYVDDVYIADTEGEINNDFLGDVRVKCLFPNGTGTSNTWHPHTANNYTLVDDVTPDLNNTYIGDNTYHGAPVALLDTYAFDDLAGDDAIDTILAIQTLFYHFLVNYNSRNGKIYAIAGGETGSEFTTITTSWIYKYDIFEGSWDASAINAAEFGVGYTHTFTSSGTPYVSQMAVEVVIANPVVATTKKRPIWQPSALGHMQIHKERLGV